MCNASHIMIHNVHLHLSSFSKSSQGGSQVSWYSRFAVGKGLGFESRLNQATTYFPKKKTTKVW